MKPLISIVTTFRNEALVIPEFVRRVRAVLAGIDKYDFEILFVDDDSSDNSLTVLKELAQQDPRLKILITSRRFGVYACLIAGLQHASGDAVIYIETDLQDPPELIPAMIEKWETGSDVVYTTRTERVGESKLKMLLTALAYKIISVIAEVPIPVNSGDYKLLSRRVAKEVIAIAEPHPYFRGLVSWVGFKQSQIFYRRDPRVLGKSHFGLFAAGPMHNFFSGLLSFSMKPLYFVAATAALVMAMAPFLLIYTLAINNPASSAVVLASLIVILTLIQMALGIGALYLARVYAALRNRPLYLLRGKIGFDDHTKHGSFCRE